MQWVVAVSCLRPFSDSRASDLKRIQTDAALGNSPLFFGEWSLATQFNANASDTFMKQWADAQKLAYGKGAGWLVRVLPLVSWRSHGTKTVAVLEL